LTKKEVKQSQNLNAKNILISKLQALKSQINGVLADLFVVPTMSSYASV